MDLLLRLKRIFNLIKWNHHLIHIHLNSYFMSEDEKIFKLTNAHEKSNQILTNNAINFFPIVELRNGGGPHFDTVGLYVRDSALNGIPSLFIFSHLMAIEETEIIDTILHEYTHGIIEVAKAILSEEYDRDKIIDYAIQMKNTAIVRRLGYLCEIFGVDIELPRATMRNYLRLDPTLPHNGKRNGKWRLTINIKCKELEQLE